MEKILASLLLIGAIAFNNSASASPCPGQTCDVPWCADCASYSEWIVSGPITGGPTSHTGTVLTTLQASNCNKEAANLKGTSTYSKTTTLSGSYSITAGATATAGIKADISVVIAEAEGTLGVSMGVSHTLGGTYTSSTTISDTWAYDVPACKIDSVQIIADWIDGGWTKTSFRKGQYWYGMTCLYYGPYTVTCDSATGASTASVVYKTWNVSALPQADCSPCN